MPTKRGASWQGVVYHQSLAGGRARRNFATEKSAKAWELESKAKLLKGEAIDLGEAGGRPSTHRGNGLPYTLSELIDHVERTRWASKAGGKRMATQGRALIKLIGPNKPVASLNKLDIDVARGKLLQMGDAPGTVNRKVRALGTCLTEAVDMELIDKKPKLSMYAEAEHRIRRLSKEEEQAAIDYFERMGEPDMVDFIILSIDTGLRQGEMLGLLHRDVDGRVVHVWGTGAKSGKSRSVPLTERAKRILAARQGKPAEPIFSMTADAVRWQWSKLATRMELTDDKQFVPHIMRHEFCSRLADKGVNAPVIQQLAGHSTLAVTQRYIHTRADHLMSAINALN